MDKIAVATDFSVRSDRALLRATLLARKTGARLILIHVVDEDQPDALISAGRLSASAVLGAMAATLHAEGVAAEQHVIVADVPSGILESAARIGCDVVVLGPHRSRALDVFTGTTVERVVRISRMPLYIAVDTPAKHHERTLLALDFNAPSKAAALAAKELGVFDHTQVTILHVFDASAEAALNKRAMVDRPTIHDYLAAEKQAAEQKLHKLVAEVGVPRASLRNIALTGTLAGTILECAKRELADLIIIGTTQRSGVERLLAGSVTSDVIKDAHRDILIVPVP
jgi:nucleotide-binding universal stress UspA family protein